MADQNRSGFEEELYSDGELFGYDEWGSGEEGLPADPLYTRPAQSGRPAPRSRAVPRQKGSRQSAARTPRSAAPRHSAPAENGASDGGEYAAGAESAFGAYYDAPAEDRRERPAPQRRVTRPAPERQPRADRPRPAAAEARRAPREQPVRKPGEEPRSGHGWRIFVMVYSLIILLVGSVGLVVLYRYLDAYEQSRPAHVLDEYIALKSEDDWLALLLRDPGIEVTEFEDAEAIVTGYFDDACRGKAVTWREATGVSTAKEPVFTVKAGSADVARVTLEPDRSLSFGLNTWKLGEETGYISASSLASVSVSIEAPSDEQLSLNGVPVSESYLTDHDIPVGELKAPENRYSDPPHRVCYTVPGLYGDLTVTRADGTELHPQTESTMGGNVLYSAEQSELYSFSVTAPAVVTVSVCGTELTEEEESGRDLGILKGLEKYFGSADPTTVTYSASGLYRKPEFTAEAPVGMEIEQYTAEDGSVSYVLKGDEGLKSTMQSTAEEFFELYLSYGLGGDYAFLQLMNHILPGTELYTYVQQSTDAMYWASNTKLDYTDKTYGNFVSWGENCFTCRVSYQATANATAWHESYNYDLDECYDMAFVREGGVWLCAAMQSAK